MAEGGGAEGAVTDPKARELLQSTEFLWDQNAKDDSWYRRNLERLAAYGSECYERGLREGREQAARHCETDEVMLPIDDWRGTKKEFGAKIALALAASIRQIK